MELWYFLGNAYVILYELCEYLGVMIEKITLKHI